MNRVFTVHVLNYLFIWQRIKQSIQSLTTCQLTIACCPNWFCMMKPACEPPRDNCCCKTACCNWGVVDTAVVACLQKHGVDEKRRFTLARDIINSNFKGIQLPTWIIQYLYYTSLNVNFFHPISACMTMNMWKKCAYVYMAPYTNSLNTSLAVMHICMNIQLWDISKQKQLHPLHTHSDWCCIFIPVF